MPTFSMMSVEVQPNNNIRFEVNTNNFINQISNAVSNIFNEQTLFPSNNSNDFFSSIFNNSQSVFSDGFFTDILQESFNNPRNELKKDDDVKITLDPIKYKKKTQEMKHHLIKCNVNYRNCKTKTELTELFKQHYKQTPECSICKECININKDNDTYLVPCCKQYFHVECLDEWVKYKKDCPLCRKNIT